MHADLTSFVVDRFITPDYLWLLSPTSDAVWEIKSRRLEPQVRVFGQFAQKNIFVAMTYQYRSDLGAFDDLNWTIEIRRVRAYWRRLFPSYSALTTTDQHKLFRGALDEKYFRD